MQKKLKKIQKEPQPQQPSQPLKKVKKVASPTPQPAPQPEVRRGPTREEILENLVAFLSGFGRFEAPAKYYRAYKILILGSDEFDAQKDKIIDQAIHDRDKDIKLKVKY